MAVARNSIEYCAEIAQSHEGSLGYVFNILQSLKQRGVTIAKFQMHFPEFESTYLEPFRVNMVGQDISRSAYWKRTGFTFEEWTKIKNYCDELEIEFLCTPLSYKAVEYLEELKVTRYKISSADITNYELLELVLNTRKPIILSTGMATYAEIDAAIKMFQHRNITLLQCTSKYPTNEMDLDLLSMQEFKRQYPDIRVGFSDHSGSPIIAMLAYAFGAQFVEQHVVYSREQYGPDSLASIEIDQIPQILEYLRMQILLSHQKNNKDEVSASLQDLRMMFQRGLSVKHSIRAGTVITQDMLTLKKPFSEIGWNMRFRFIGKTVIRDINQDEHLKFEDVGEK